MIQSVQGRSPALHPSVRAARGAVLVGDVRLEEGVSVWYGAVLRGDEDAVHVGAGTNIQDNAVVHCDQGYPARIGRGVTVGHGAVLHGCTVEDGCVIGMGAVLLNGCVVGAGSLVAAGALVAQNTVIAPGSLAMGSPARVTRPLRPEEARSIGESAAKYRALARAQLPVCAEGEAE